MVIVKVDQVKVFLQNAFTAFWEEFYEKCTLGTHAKVPSLRHDFSECQWLSVGGTLLFSWQKFNLLPT